MPNYSQVKQDIVSALAQMPNHIRSQQGEVFSSGLSSISEGDFYILGLNPGGGDSYPSIYEHVQNWNLESYSAFTQQCWKTECWDKDCYGLQQVNACSCEKGDTRHQEAVQRMITRCGVLDIKKVFATNAVFAKSTSANTFKKETGFTMQQAFDAYWSVHVYLMSVIKPKIIISLGYQDGGSAFSLFKGKGRLESKISSHIHDGRKFAAFKWASIKFDDIRIPGAPLLVGIRHPSWVIDAADCIEFETLIKSELTKHAHLDAT